MTTDSRTPSSQARWLALYVLCLGDLMIVLDVTIVGVALPVDPRGSRLLGDVARVGRQRLPAHVRRLSPARREARRSLRAPPSLPRRHLALHPGLARLRARDLPGAPGHRTGGAGSRRRGRVRGRPLADDDALHGACGPGEGDGDLRLRRLRRRLDRRPPRRHPDRRAQLALDLPRQRSGRASSSSCSR